MKYKIPKFQGGGLATFTPILDQMPSGAMRPQAEEEKSSLLDSSIYEELLGKGLINDVNLFVSKIQQLESDPLNFMSPGGTTKGVQTIAEINAVLRNKQMYDVAIKSAQDSGGWDEEAVDSQGNVYYLNSKGNVDKMQLSQYKKDNKKPYILSVSELMKHREMNPSLAMNTSLFDVANNSTGITEITDKIRNMATLLKEFSDTKEDHYSKKQIMNQIKAISGGNAADLRSGEQFKVLNNLSNADLQAIVDTPGEYFKVTSKTSKNGRDLKSSAQYIWATLSRPDQLKLEAVAARQGYVDPTKFVGAMLVDYEGVKTEFSVSPEEGPNKQTENDIFANRKPLTVLQLIHKDKLMKNNTTFGFNDTKLGSLFRNTMAGVSPIVTATGDTVGMQTLYSIFNNPKIGYGVFLEQDKARVGDKAITDAQQNQLIYDGKDAAKVYMPVDGAGNVDWKSLGEFKDLYAEYENNKDSWTAEQATKFFKDSGYELTITQDGQDKVVRESSRVKPFYNLYAYTNDAVDLVEDNDLAVSKLSRQEEKAILPFLKQIWTMGSGKNTTDMTPDGWFGEDYFKVLVTVPYRAGYAALVDASVNQGPQEKEVLMEQVAANLKGTQQKPTGSTSADVFNK